MYAIKDKASEICIKSLANLFAYCVAYCINGEWHDQMKAPYYALLAQRLKQMAEISPREKDQPNETQSGTIKVTLKGENYSFHVSATIAEGCEQLSLRLESA